MRLSNELLLQVKHVQTPKNQSMKTTVVNIRGTHGSGKSTVVRRVLELLGDQVPEHVDGRTRPISYLCHSGRLRVLGHYETPTGGCDTISKSEKTYELMRVSTLSGVNVLFEGILAQHSTGRLVELIKSTTDVDYKIVVLSTSLEECIASVKKRRDDRGVVGDFDPRNVTREYKSVLSSTRRLEHDGVRVLRLDRESAFRDVCEILSLRQDGMQTCVE